MKYFPKISIVSATKKCLSFTLVVSLLGCQLISQPEKSQPSYGQYYLWLKSLTSEEIVQEIAQQKQSLNDGNLQAKVHLLLLHSLPSSPIHNAYTAKTILNKQKNQYVESHYNSTNLALLAVLKDQLNQQLLILNRLSEKSNALLLSKQQYQAVDKLHATNEALVTQLKQQVVQLKQQIQQLKRIEKNINEHGQ